MAAHLGGPWSLRPFAAPGAAFPWRGVQTLVLLGGVVLVATLILRPSLGLDLFWNGLIPLAPALIVIAPGVWRNICPMATFSLLPGRIGRARERPMPHRSAAVLAMLGLAALVLIVPLRHVLLDTDGPATALMLTAAAALALWLGRRYDWRSGWCNGLCPIHPVEKLYGQAPAFTPANARCGTCRRCSTPCPDSTRSMNPLVTGPSRLAKAAGHVMTGGFAGFVLGWYQVPDYPGAVTLGQIAAGYAWPLGGGLASLALYTAAYRRYGQTAAGRTRLARLFAAAAVAGYYWYRIPALAGFGPHPGTGMLIDLTAVWPALPWLTRPLTTGFFVWFMLVRPSDARSWLIRPARVPDGPCGQE